MGDFSNIENKSRDEIDANNEEVIFSNRYMELVFFIIRPFECITSGNGKYTPLTFKTLYTKVFI